jgi:hypothetical protein
MSFAHLGEWGAAVQCVRRAEVRSADQEDRQNTVNFNRFSRHTAARRRFTGVGARAFGFFDIWAPLGLPNEATKDGIKPRIKFKIAL